MGGLEHGVVLGMGRRLSSFDQIGLRLRPSDGALWGQMNAIALDPTLPLTNQLTIDSLIAIDHALNAKIDLNVLSTGATTEAMRLGHRVNAVVNAVAEKARLAIDHYIRG